MKGNDVNDKSYQGGRIKNSKTEPIKDCYYLDYFTYGCLKKQINIDNNKGSDD